MTKKLSIAGKITWRGTFGVYISYITSCRTANGIKKQAADWLKAHPDVRTASLDIYYPDICGDNGKTYQYIDGEWQ